MCLNKQIKCVIPNVTPWHDNTKIVYLSMSSKVFSDMPKLLQSYSKYNITLGISITDMEEFLIVSAVLSETD